MSSLPPSRPPAAGVRPSGATGTADHWRGPGTTTRVVVPLPGVDAWPPYAAERLWAFDLGEGRYRLDNVPWFAMDLAAGDVVEARTTTPDATPVAAPVVEPVLERVVERSAHLTLRVVCFRHGPLAGRVEPVVEAFEQIGARTEALHALGLVALDLPPGLELRAVHECLKAGRADGSWEFDEGRVDDAWYVATLQQTRRRFLGLF